MPTDLIGLTFGSYKLVELIGRGGMATVYRGFQESIDRSVAIKVLPPEFLHDPSFSQRFIAEARTLAKLTHPAILPLYDFGAAHDVPYIVMPLMTGGTLNDRIHRGSLSLAEVIRLFTPIADALDFAHSQGVVHRDIKPSNILFDQRGQPFLGDFGIAKALEATTHLTGTAIVGTPDYMSPEQARGEPIDNRSDVYSFGVMAYQCLSGDTLFKATTPIGVMLKHATEPPPPIRQIRAEVPQAAEDVLTKVLAKQPNERYQSAGDFLKALAAASGIEAAQGQMRPTTPPPPTPTISPTIRPAAPVTGQVVEQPTAAQPLHPPTVQGAQPAKAKGGGVGTAILGGGIGMFVGGVLVVVLIIACCIGLFALAATSATPTPNPTNTPLPTPTPDFVFYDTFSDPDSGWGTGTDAESSVEYDNGEFAIEVFTDNYFVWSTPGMEDVGNIYVEAVARNVSGESETAFGVLCHHQEEDSYYYFAITSAGDYAIAKATEGQEDLFLTNNDQWAESDAIVKNAASYRIGADCASNGRLTMYVDGREIASVTDSTYTRGEVGVLVWTGDQPNAEIRFDDLAVLALP